MFANFDDVFLSFSFLSDLAHVFEWISAILWPNVLKFAGSLRMITVLWMTELYLSILAYVNFYGDYFKFSACFFGKNFKWSPPKKYMNNIKKAFCHSELWSLSYKVMKFQHNWPAQFRDPHKKCSHKIMDFRPQRPLWAIFWEGGKMCSCSPS